MTTKYPTVDINDKQVSPYDNVVTSSFGRMHRVSNNLEKAVTMCGIDLRYNTCQITNGSLYSYKTKCKRCFK